MERYYGSKEGTRNSSQKAQKIKVIRESVHKVTVENQPSGSNGNGKGKGRKCQVLSVQAPVKVQQKEGEDMTQSKQPIQRKGKGKGKKSQVLSVQAPVRVQQKEAGQSKEDMTPAKKPIWSKDKGKGKKSQVLSA